jgi:hypothetical protein
MTRQRKALDRLTPTEEEKLRAAFQALLDSKNAFSNYDYWALIHDDWWQHHSELFFPWHRAYIFAFETALRRAIGDETLTLPYWDWVTTPRIPEQFERPPLTPPLPTDRYTVQNRPACARLPLQADVDLALAQHTFFGFGGAGCSDPSSGGELENIHGWVHSWVGPLMADVTTTTFDPIFWCHHANVDRLWDLWQRDHPDEPSCEDAILGGIPGPWKVSDVLKVGSPKLRYEYVLDTLTISRRKALRADAIEMEPFDIPVGTKRLLVHLHGIESRGQGPIPSFLEVYLNHGRQPVYALSLFGLHSEPAADMPRTTHGRIHHHRHHHFDARFELTNLSDDRPLRIQLDFVSSCPPPGQPSATIDVAEVSVAFLM